MFQTSPQRKATEMLKVRSYSEGVTAQTPCEDCPFSRESMPGWLGGGTVDEWLALAHGEVSSECHVKHTQQCAGLAIYRANVGKRPRDPLLLRLPSNKKACFSTIREFIAHHGKRDKTC